ncbi:MAG: hypothetical protein ACE37K_07205 [Planctomycetota bacterium]
MNGRSRTPDDATAFREVVSQWLLAARTEVKKASSLPSSMFDASDPMLEARLAETVEAMMQLLHEPEAAALARQASGEHLELRAEHVSDEELRALPHHIRHDLDEADLEDHVSSEYLNLLIDTCTTGDAPTQAAARALLAQDFDVASTSDLDAATQELFHCMQRVIGAAGADEADERRLAELCEAIAATVVVAANQPEEPNP